MSIENELDVQELAERAFNRAEDFTFRGKPLHAWDYLRKDTARTLGLKWGIITSRDVIDLGDGVETYVGIERDVVILLWCMSHDGPENRRARSNPQAHQETLDTWAESMKLLTSGMSLDEEALKLFMSVMLDVRASSGIPKVESSDSKKNPPSRKRQTT